MKRISFFLLTLLLAVFVSFHIAASEAPAYKEGMPLPEGGPFYECIATADDIIAAYSVDPSYGSYYTPADPKPLGAYMITHENCQVGRGTDIEYIRDHGLISEMGSQMADWMNEIRKHSGHAINFVTSPDEASVLIIVNMQYPFYAKYSGISQFGGFSVDVYSCSLDMEAINLTNTSQRTTASWINEPGDTISISSTRDDYLAYSPWVTDTDEIKNFTQSIMEWYGYKAENGSYGEGVRYAQQALIDRGFLEGAADGSFGPATEEAVKKLQAYCGLEQTGIIDRKTVVALYYEKEALEYIEEEVE